MYLIVCHFSRFQSILNICLTANKALLATNRHQYNSFSHRDVCRLTSLTVSASKTFIFSVYLQLLINFKILEVGLMKPLKSRRMFHSSRISRFFENKTRPSERVGVGLRCRLMFPPDLLKATLLSVHYILREFFGFLLKSLCFVPHFWQPTMHFKVNKR